jgi:hypothetical protein
MFTTSWGTRHFGQGRGVSLRLVIPAPAAMMEEMPDLRRENVMIAATDTSRVPMRLSKAELQSAPRPPDSGSRYGE